MYINQRWLGGMMTNFGTIQNRIERLVHLEEAFSKGTVVAQTKRESLKLSNELERLKKFFGGIMEMRRLPDVLFVVDITEEVIAVAESLKLGIPVVAMVDTNCDPGLVQYPIPSNDDSIRSIKLITKHISEAIISGKEIAKKAHDDKLASEAILEAQEAKARSKAQAKAAEKSPTSNSKRGQEKSKDKKRKNSTPLEVKTDSDKDNKSNELKKTKSKETKIKESKVKEAKTSKTKKTETKSSKKEENSKKND